MEFELKTINIWSVVKIVFVISLAIGALIGIFNAFIFTFINSIFQNTYIDELNITYSSISIFYMIMFFAISISLFHSVLSIIFIGCYNLISNWIGGIKFDLHISNENITKIVNIDELEN